MAPKESTIIEVQAEKSASSTTEVNLKQAVKRVEKVDMVLPDGKLQELNPSTYSLSKDGMTLIVNSDQLKAGLTNLQVTVDIAA